MHKSHSRSRQVELGEVERLIIRLWHNWRVLLVLISPGDPYSWRGRRQILGITSMRVFTYCRMVPCNWKRQIKWRKCSKNRVRERETTCTLNRETNYQALDNLEQLLHHHSDALVTKKTADCFEMRRTHKVPVGTVDVGVGDVQRLKNRVRC